MIYTNIPKWIQHHDTNIYTNIPKWIQHHDTNGTITYKPHRQQRRQRAQAHNSTPYRRQQSFM
jgi:hypothetical protein